jgi:hypothetical protein
MGKRSSCLDYAAVRFPNILYASGDETREVPSVLVELEPTSHLGELVVVIANRGTEQAHSVKFRVLKDFSGMGPVGQLSDLFAIRHGFSHIPPGKEYRFPLFFSFDRVGGDDLCAQIEISYRRQSGSTLDSKMRGMRAYALFLEGRSKHGQCIENCRLDASSVMSVAGKCHLEPARHVAWEIEALRESLEAREHSSRLRRDMLRRPCPLCREPILAHAKVCSHCLRDLPPEEAAEPPSELDMIE